MSDNDYRGVRHVRTEYPCGLRAGDRLRLKARLEIKDHGGQPTGVTHEPGEIWVVTTGVASEPDVIWLREPNGDSHTWDGDDVFDSFERV